LRINACNVSARHSVEKKDKLRTAVAAALLLGDMKHGPAAAAEAD